MFKKLKQKVKNKVWADIEKKIQVKVQEYEVHLIDLVCNRIEFLSVQKDFNIDILIQDLKNGGYKDDEKKYIGNN